MSDDDLDRDEAYYPKLGPCCICETETGVGAIIMLDRRGLVPGHGWGCIVCGLPSDGASAVLCETCCDEYLGAETALKFVCRGYPATYGRAPFADLPEGEFKHDMDKHTDD